MRITKDEKKRILKKFKDENNVYSIDDVKRLHQGYFFSKDTMRFFSSRLIDEVYPTADNMVVFVTSEKKGFNDSNREFSVRVYDIKLDAMSKIISVDSRAIAMTLSLSHAFDLYQISLDEVRL